ncbi:MAG: type II toxin-antitoxin system RelE/ParE family toxin [Rubrivivax sp.]
MAWTVELLPVAAKELRKLDRGVAQRLLKFLDARVRQAHDPREVGEALRGERPGVYWKYRVGDYRLICRIEDAQVLVLVVRIGHRSDIYRD